MRTIAISLAALTLLAAPAATPAEGDSGLTVLDASVRFGRERAGQVPARLRLRGDLQAGSGLAAHRPGGPGLHLGLGSLDLLDGTTPIGARVTTSPSGAWRLTLRKAFGGRGRLTVRMVPGNGLFRVGVWLGTKPTGGVTVQVGSVTPASILGAPCTPSGCPPTGAMASIVETQWGPSCVVTQALTQPFHIVTAPRVEGPVLYEMITRVNDCP